MQLDQAGTQGAALADDMLVSAEEIALFIYGDKSKRRRIYHLHETTDIPIFSVGRTLHARKSRLLAWIEQSEQRATPGTGAAS